MDHLLPFLEIETVWRACQYNNLDHAIFLATHGFDMMERDDQGRTPLHLVATTGHLELASVLLQHGAEVSAEDASGKSPLQVAKEAGNTAMVQLLETDQTRHQLMDGDLSVSSTTVAGLLAGLASGDPTEQDGLMACVEDFAFTEPDA